MPTVLNNTNRNFMAFYNSGTPTAPLLQRAQVGPGFSQVSDRDLKILRTDAHFIKACDLKLVVINAGAADETEEKLETTPLEIAEISAPEPAEPVVLPEPEVKPKPKSKTKAKNRPGKNKKVEADFKDFD